MEYIIKEGKLVKTGSRSPMEIYIQTTKNHFKGGNKK